MKLLIGTIYTKPVHHWLDLQLEFLRRTTPAHSLVVLFTQEAPDQYFMDRAECHQLPPHSAVPSKEHTMGLNWMAEHFTKTDADCFLFLDMDAFPVREGWLDVLTRKMLARYEIAVALRCENLERRFHASILFAKRCALPHLKFVVGGVGHDLVGDTEHDVYIPAYQTERKNKVFPLLRSNAWNPHPTLFGVYFDMFYHHGCGSGRRNNMRSRPYWDHMVSKDYDLGPMTSRLVGNPTSFIHELRHP